MRLGQKLSVEHKQNISESMYHTDKIGNRENQSAMWRTNINTGEKVYFHSIAEATRSTYDILNTDPEWERLRERIRNCARGKSKKPVEGCYIFTYANKINSQKDIQQQLNEALKTIIKLQAECDKAEYENEQLKNIIAVLQNELNSAKNKNEELMSKQEEKIEKPKKTENKQKAMTKNLYIYDNTLAADFINVEDPNVRHNHMDCIYYSMLLFGYSKSLQDIFYKINNNNKDELFSNINKLFISFEPELTNNEPVKTNSPKSVFNSDYLKELNNLNKSAKTINGKQVSFNKRIIPALFVKNNDYMTGKNIQKYVIHTLMELMQSAPNFCQALMLMSQPNYPLEVWVNSIDNKLKSVLKQG